MNNPASPFIRSVRSRLEALAATHEADALFIEQPDLKEDSVVLTTLIIYWTGADEPREAHLFFGFDGLIWAFCYEPSLYMNAVDEGLDNAAAEDCSRRMVISVDDVESYLLGRPYKVTAPRIRGLTD